MDQPTNNSDVLHSLSNTLADAVETISPSLLRVNGRRRQSASGIAHSTNLIVTADHVLEREEDLSIETHDGQTLPVTFVGRDPSSDLAVLRVADATLQPAEVAEGARVGQLLLSVGRPSSEGPQASVGIVSAVGGPVRTGRGGMLEKYIRTDAIPYPGFSGGPLINTQGAVLAVMTTGLVNGVALGIPAGNAWRITETLATHGYIKRGYLGISSQPVHLPEAQRAGRNQASGLLIMRVDDGTPAAKGGLLLGDILISLDGEPVGDIGDLQTLLIGDRVGRAVPVEIIRGGALQQLEVTIGEASGRR